VKLKNEQDSVANEEDGYPVPDFNKTMINITKKPSDTHIKTLKEEFLEDITREFMEKILVMVNQNVQDALKKFQDTKEKKMRRHRNK
jgi:disulfide oxidoreductase YuzD